MGEKLNSLKYSIRSPFLDIGKEEETILLFGMGRSGTTWVANIINYDKSYRILFEPFFPELVPEARMFEYIQYMDPDDGNEPFAQKARKILAGKTRSQWVDRDNQGILYRRRIIKDIRCNLMAGWLNRIAPTLPLVLLIRHPLQVAASWLKLGWGTEALGKRSDYEIITSQDCLLKHFPLIKEVAQKINPEEFLDNVIFLWAVLYFVPLKQLVQNKTYCLFYENLITDPKEECNKLFNYLRKPFLWDKVQKIIYRESSTNFQNRELSSERTLLLNSWKKEFSKAEIQRSNEILNMFGLDTIYDVNGIPSFKNNCLPV